MDEYAEAIEQLPPLDVFEDPKLPGTLYIADGEHRFAAWRKTGRKRPLRGWLHKGTLADAYLFGFKRNLTQGRRLTLSERDAAIRHLHKDHPGLGVRGIAAQLGGLVSHTTVGKVLKRPAHVPSKPVGRPRGKKATTDPALDVLALLRALRRIVTYPAGRLLPALEKGDAKATLGMISTGRDYLDSLVTMLDLSLSRRANVDDAAPSAKPDAAASRPAAPPKPPATSPTR